MEWEREGGRGTDRESEAHRQEGRHKNNGVREGARPHRPPPSGRTGLAVEDADEVGEVVEDGEVVLDDDDVVVLLEQRPDRLGRVDALLHVEVRRGLVEPARAGAARRDGEKEGRGDARAARARAGGRR